MKRNFFYRSSIKLLASAIALLCVCSLQTNAQVHQSKKIKNFAVAIIPLKGPAYQSLDMGNTWTEVQNRQLLTTGITAQKNLSSDLLLTLRVYPNPSTEYLDVEITSRNPTANGHIVAVNVLGEKYSLWNGSVDNGTNSVRLDVSGLAKGSYFLRVEQGDNSTSVGFIRQ